ncbi:MAG: hypothetical protein ABI836_15860 [Gemmatimonadota bacterium]
MSPSRLKLASSAILLAAAVFACSEGATNPNVDRPNLTTIGNPGVADTGEVELCKWGTQAKFAVTVDGVTGHRFYLGPNACQVIATSVDLGNGNHTVTVVEDVLKGTAFDSIVGTVYRVNDPAPVRGAPITNTHQITKVFNGDRGWLFEFYNQ